MELEPNLQGATSKQVKKQMSLHAFTMCCPGRLWRHDSDQSHRYTDVEYWLELAKLLDDAGFHSLFLADVVGLYDVYGGNSAAALRNAVQVPINDPVPIIAAMSAVTKKLGYGVTVSTTYNQPYTFARTMTTLDHLSKGRVAWNIVSSYLDSAARNLGYDAQLPHDERYEIADEFMSVCYKLWEQSWEEDAVVRDKSRGIYTDPSRVHSINHEGQYFTVRDAHLSEPSPQRTPVLFQAGSSSKGSAFAGKHAEVVFAGAPNARALRKHVDRIRAEAESNGRDRNSIQVITMLAVIVGHSKEEAEAKAARYQEMASREGALVQFGGWTGLDLSDVPGDQPVEHIESQGMRTAIENFTRNDPDRVWTVNELGDALKLSGGGGAMLVGTASEIVDQMEEWAEAADIDGFNVSNIVLPDTFKDFAELVVPELNRRGLLLKTTEGATLREQLNPGHGARLNPNHPGAGLGRPAAIPVAAVVS